VYYTLCAHQRTLFFFFPSSRNRKRGALPLFRPYLIGKVFHILYHSYSDYTPSLHIAHRGVKIKIRRTTQLVKGDTPPPLFLVWFVAPISFLAKISYSHIRGGAVSSIAYPISLRSRTTIYVKTTTNKPRFYLPHILRIWASGNFCVLYPSCTPENIISFRTHVCHSPPSVSAQALCFSVLDAVFGMTLEFGKSSCRLGAMWGGAVSLVFPLLIFLFWFSEMGRRSLPYFRT